MLNTQTNSTTSTEEHVFLVGRPPIGEYLGMIASEAGAGKPVDLGPLADDWRTRTIAYGNSRRPTPVRRTASASGNFLRNSKIWRQGR